MSPMRDGTTSEDSATQLLICEPLSFAISSAIFTIIDCRRTSLKVPNQDLQQLEKQYLADCKSLGSQCENENTLRKTLGSFQRAVSQCNGGLFHRLVGGDVVSCSDSG